MSSRIRIAIGRVALLSVLVLAGAISPSSAQGTSAREADEHDGSKSQARRLEGTWFTSVTIRDCQSGAALRTFPALNTFAHGGTLIDTTTAVSPALRSPGHGFWDKTGRRTFRAVSLAFLFTPAGVLAGTQKITQLITLGADDYSSNASSEVFSPDGNLLSTGCSTAVARPIE
jgi:hypothetical protein